jgi:hypothetical protein
MIDVEQRTDLIAVPPITELLIHALLLFEAKNLFYVIFADFTGGDGKIFYCCSIFKLQHCTLTILVLV